LAFKEAAGTSGSLFFMPQAMWSLLMRTLLIPVLALSVAACGKDGQENNNQAAGETLTADSIVSNDVTAIDAVTGDAAKMAADVDMNFGNLDRPEGNASSEDSSKKSDRASSRSNSKPAAEANSVANAASNEE
jgi:hypothetical protein